MSRSCNLRIILIDVSVWDVVGWRHRLVLLSTAFYQYVSFGVICHFPALFFRFTAFLKQRMLAVVVVIHPEVHSARRGFLVNKLSFEEVWLIDLAMIFSLLALLLLHLGQDVGLGSQIFVAVSLSHANTTGEEVGLYLRDLRLLMTPNVTNSLGAHPNPCIDGVQF